MTKNLRVNYHIMILLVFTQLLSIGFPYFHLISNDLIAFSMHLSLILCFVCVLVPKLVSLLFSMLSLFLGNLEAMIHFGNLTRREDWRRANKRSKIKQMKMWSVTNWSRWLIIVDDRSKNRRSWLDRLLTGQNNRSIQRFFFGRSGLTGYQTIRYWPIT